MKAGLIHTPSLRVVGLMVLLMLSVDLVAGECPSDQQCFCIPSFSATGPDANGIVHFHASIHGGCNRGATFSFEPPTDATIYLNQQWNDGQDYPTDLDVTCWPAGTYTVSMHSHCSYCIGGILYPIDPDPAAQQVTFTVSRTPTASLAFEEDEHRLAINYNYGISQQGQMRLFKNGLDAGPLNCGGGSGTCYVTANKTCIATWYKVKIRACEADPYVESDEIELVLPKDVCGVADDSTNCQPQDDCKSCPVNPSPPSPCVGKPINVGSGDVSATIPLFTIDQPHMPLRFDLSYHSLTPAYPNAMSTTMGLGWTHSFNSSLRLADDQHFPGLLMLVTPHGQRYYFPQENTGLWLAAKPIGSKDQVVTSGNERILVSLDGSQTHFDAGSGHWVSTSDRWGNTIRGAYVNNLLTTITDSVDRTVTLTYTSGSLTGVQLPTGETWHFDYTNGELSAIREPISGGTWRTFEYTTDSHDVSRLLTAVRDAGGKLLEGHSYDGSDRGLTSSAEGGRRAVSVEYDTPTMGQARVTETIDSTDDSTTTRISTFTLLQQNSQYLISQLAGVCSTCGGTEVQTYAHDDLDRVVSATDAAGQVTTFTYDYLGNVITKVEAVGTPFERTTTFRYDYPAWPTFPTSESGPSATGSGVKTTTRAWNSDETVLTTTESGKLNAADPGVSYTTTTTFDTRHRVLSFDGPRTDVTDDTTNVYYGDTDTNLGNRGRLNTVTNALSQIATLADYDVFGTPRSTTDANGVISVRTTDARGRTTSVTNQAVPGDPNETASYQSTMTFDARDRLTDAVSPRGVHTRYGYEDGTNLLTDTIRLDLSGSNELERHHVTYDLAGQKIEEQDQACASPAGTCSSWTTKRDETYKYDSFGRLAEADHGGDKIVYAYDANGLLTSVQDENHTTPNTTYAYDALHRLASVTQTLAGAPNDAIATQYAYDAQDNLISVTDPNGNVTTYAYDDFRRLQNQVSPVTGTTTYAYDPAGNLLTTTDGNGLSTVRIYDALNRPTRSTSSAPFDTQVINSAYDTGAYGVGRLAGVVDNFGTTTYMHERRGLLRSEVRAVSSGTFTTGYSYDADGNRSSITYPSGRVVSYTYDYAGRPLSVSSGSTSYASAASYLPFGPLTSLTFGNGTVKTMHYDNRYRVTENALALGAATLADYTYASDATGNITQIHDALDATFNRDFGYDDLNRLTTANSGSSLWGSGAYHYDRMGNLLSLDLGGTVEVDPNEPASRPHQAKTESLPAPGSRHETFAYVGVTPKLAIVTSDGIDHPITYDAAGNETHSFVDRSYDSRNQLASVTDSTVESYHRVAYLYDSHGLRVQRFESTASANDWVSRDFFYSPELQLLTVTRDNGPNVWTSRRRPTTMTVADPMHEIIWLGSLPVAQVSPGDLHFPLRYTFTDHLGTPILQTDPAGISVWRAEHEPYGQVWTMRQGTRTEQPLRLPGQELAMTWEGQEENYNIFRWYRGGWGRYTQPDPLAVQEPRIFLRQARPHEFAYAAQDPINNSDLTGLCTKCDTCPSGKWTVDPFGFGASAAFGVGVTYQQTVYTCQDNGYALKIKTTCAVLGAIAGAGLGVTAPGKACGCNVSDLLTPGNATKGWTGWIGPVNIDINTCTDNDPIATSGGISKSWGAGFAKTWCWSEEKK